MSKKSKSIICVDRSIRPSYPKGTKVMYPKLETTGPAKYDIGKVRRWLHMRQKNEKWLRGERRHEILTSGHVVHRYLKNTYALRSCLGLRDLEEIKKKGIAFFRKHFQYRDVFYGWRSVVSNGRLFVPCIYEEEVTRRVKIRWVWLRNSLSSTDIALRFPRKV